jgi:hypothetical protein
VEVWVGLEDPIVDRSIREIKMSMIHVRLGQTTRSSRLSTRVKTVFENKEQDEKYEK